MPPRAQGSRIGGPALNCTGLVKRYGDLTAVDGLDLTVRRGECFGLLGPNGAGKTTTIEILEGLLAPDAGAVEVLGSRWGADDDALRQRLGIHLQETQFDERLSAAETLGLFRSFYREGRPVADVLETVGLESKAGTWVVHLSGGQRQRLAVGCALVGDPELLFLDEPTTGLDPQSRRQLWSVLQRFRAAGGSLLLTTHYMDEAQVLCDRVAIVDGGRIIAEGTPRELIASLGAAHVIEFGLPSGEGRGAGRGGSRPAAGRAARRPERRPRRRPLAARCRGPAGDAARPDALRRGRGPGPRLGHHPRRNPGGRVRLADGEAPARWLT